MTSNGIISGTVGYAWLGTVCNPTFNFKTTVNEYFSNDLSTGIVRHFEKEFILHLGNLFTANKKKQLVTSNWSPPVGCVMIWNRISPV